MSEIEGERAPREGPRREAPHDQFRVGEGCVRSCRGASERERGGLLFSSLQLLSPRYRTFDYTLSTTRLVPAPAGPLSLLLLQLATETLRLARPAQTARHAPSLSHGPSTTSLASTTTRSFLVHGSRA